MGSHQSLGCSVPETSPFHALPDVSEVNGRVDRDGQQPLWPWGCSGHKHCNQKHLLDRRPCSPFSCLIIFISSVPNFFHVYLVKIIFTWISSFQFQINLNHSAGSSTNSTYYRLCHEFSIISVKQFSWNNFFTDLRIGWTYGTSIFNQSQMLACTVWAIIS